jgi:hypothetical protein
MNFFPRGFGWRVLWLVTFGVMLFGMSLIFIAPLMQVFFNVIVFGGADYPPDFSQSAIDYITFVYGILGAVIAGWMLPILYLIGRVAPQKPRVVVQVVAASVGFWFVLDSGFSVYTGYTVNVALNSAFLLAFGLPLAWLWRRSSNTNS